MHIWIFIAVISAAAVAELILSARALEKYTVIVPVMCGVRTDRSTLEEIYGKFAENNSRALMVIYTDDADEEMLEMCRGFSRDKPRAVIYCANL